MNKDAIKRKYFIKKKKDMLQAIKKHFGFDMTEKLQKMTGYELAGSDILEDFSATSIGYRVSCVQISIMPKISALRALYEEIENLDDDDNIKSINKKLRPMIKNLKDRSAFEIVYEFAMGGNPFPISVNKLMVLLTELEKNRKN